MSEPIEGLEKRILGTDLKDAQIKRTWFGRKIVLIKNGKEENLTQKVRGLLKDLEGHMAELSDSSFERAVKILTKLDSLYKQSDYVSFLNPTRRLARSIGQEALLLQIASICEDLSVKHGLRDSLSGEIFQVHEKILAAKNPTKSFALKQALIRRLLGSQVDSKWLDESFVKKAWKEVEALWTSKNHFYKQLEKGKPLVLKVTPEEVNTGLSRSCHPIPVKKELEDDITVYVPGDFNDSIKRTVSSQLIGMQYSELHPDVQKKYSSKELKEAIELAEIGDDPLSLDKLGNVFLLDLTLELGSKRVHLLEPLLRSIEQSPRNYMMDKLQKQTTEDNLWFSTPVRGALCIEIPKEENGPVRVCIVSDYPARASDGDPRLLKKFAPMQLQGALTVTFKPLQNPEGLMKLQKSLVDADIRYQAAKKAKESALENHKEAADELLKRAQFTVDTVLKEKAAEEAKCLVQSSLSFKKLETPARMHRYLIGELSEKGALSPREIDLEEKTELMTARERILNICMAEKFDELVFQAEVRSLIQIHKDNKEKWMALTGSLVHYDEIENEAEKKSIKQKVAKVLMGGDPAKEGIRKKLVDLLLKDNPKTDPKEIEKTADELIEKTNKQDLKEYIESEVVESLLSLEKYYDSFERVLEKELF